MESSSCAFGFGETNKSYNYMKRIPQPKKKKKKVTLKEWNFRKTEPKKLSPNNMSNEN